MSFAEWSNEKKKKREEEQDKQRSENTKAVTGRTQSFSEWSEERTVGRVNQDYVNSFITDANSYFSSAEDEYNSIGWGNARDVYRTRSATASDLGFRSSIIRRWLDSQKGRVDEDTYKSLMSTLDSIDSDLSKATGSFKSAMDFYSQYETEDAYNEALRQREEYDYMLTADLDSVQTEIDGYKARLAEAAPLYEERRSLMASIRNAENRPNGKNSTKYKEATARVKEIDARLSEIGNPDTLRASIAEKEMFLRNAGRLQEWQGLAGVGDPTSEYYDPEFDTLSAEGAATPYYEEFGNKWVSGAGKGPASTFIDNYRAAAIALYEHQGNETPHDYVWHSDLIDKYRAMSDTQFATLAYYLEKDSRDGTNLAEQYIDSIEEGLNRLEADDRFKGLEDNVALELLFGVEAGLDQFASGLMTVMNGMVFDMDYIPVSSTQMTSQKVREDLGDSDFKIFGSTVGQIGYDAITTTSNMLPSILVSATINAAAPGVGAPVGAVLLGASASGNAYAEMLNLGYDKGQARTYSALVGASEAGLQYLLGGVKGLSGGPVKQFSANALSKIDNAFARVAISIGGEMVSEGVEEGLQTVLEAWFKSIATGVDFDAPDINEVLYSSLLGAITAAGFGGVTTSVGEAGANIQARNTFGKMERDLVSEASGLEGLPSDLAKKYQGRLDKGKSLTGSQLRTLVGATEKTHRTNDTAKIASAAEARLTELGETGDVKALAEIIAKQVAGEKLSLSEKAILKNSSRGNRVANELDAENIITGATTSEWAKGIGTKRINADVYSLAAEVAGVTPTAEQATPVETSDTGATDDTSAREVAAERVFEASEDGRTIYNGEEVTIAGIAEVKDGDVKLRLESGETVSAKDVSFGSEGEALVYEMVAREGYGVETANEIIGAYNAHTATPAATFVADATLAYRYGRAGIESGLSELSIPEQQARIVYNRGRYDAEADAEQRTKAPKARTGKPSAKSKKNGIIYEGFKYSEKSATDVQKVSIIYYEGLAMLSPTLEFHVYSSEIENGRRVAYIDGHRVENAPNGYFTRGNQVYIDINAGNNGEGVMLYTLSHEITHYIRAWNAKGFKALADFLIKHYGESGVKVTELIAKQTEKVRASLARSGETLSEGEIFDRAYEEVVADAMSTMLADPKAYEKLAELKKQNATLFQKVGEAIKKVLEKLKTLLGIYSNYTPDSVEAGHVMEFAPEVYEQLQDLYLKAFVEAEALQESAESTLAESGIMVESTDADYGTVFSVRDLLDSKQQQKVAETLAKRFGVTVEEARGWISAETSLASLILNPKYSQYLDYVGDASEEAIKSNSDYPQGTVDFSNICKKRRDFTEVMNRVLRNFPNHVFAATDLAKIRTIMSEEGMEVACGICYVEDRRQLDSIVAQDFIDSLSLYRKGSKTRPDGKAFNANQMKALSLVDGDTYTPSIYELISLEGRNLLKAKNPSMEEAWVKFNNARGMQSVRLLLNDAEYKRQILGYKPSVVARKNDLGGLRIYSFSDMEMFHLIDIIQVITDSATVGLSLQGYTKVNEYARAVKDTGEKLNRSLIPKGDLGYHMENGAVVLDFDTVEGIDINHPDFFDNIDNPNIGNIVIGINATQIRAAMTSKFIDQIIPFHTGQSGEVLGEKGIAAWVNYKDFQSERDVATGKKSAHQINIYTEVIQAAANEGKPITNKVEFVNKFLEVCKENGLVPRFSEFLNVDENGNYVYTEGYHKFLVDFKTFDQTTGEYLPQMPVKPIFDSEYLTGLLKAYAKTQKTKDAHLAATMPKVLERITNEIVKADDTMFSERDSADAATQFVAHLENILKNRGEWYVSDVFDYVAEHPELNFIERIYAKDKDAKRDLEALLSAIDDVEALGSFSWFMGEAYAQKAPRRDGNGNYVYPYRGAVRTFRNAIKNRINEIMTEKVGGTNLGVQNGDVSIEDIEELFYRLNTNEEIGEFAKKVFATAKTLGVNIRFTNQMVKVPKGKVVAGQAIGDMVRYKTSYFNDTAKHDQTKAQCILHELIHACTTYVMSANVTAGDVRWSGRSDNYNFISNAATRLNRIYGQIVGDPDFKGQYGLTNAREMVAELSNERFVALLQKKSLWQEIVDWICELFGFRRGTSAYDSARMCVDYILDNPEISEYKSYALAQREAVHRAGHDTFGSTTDMQGDVHYSERDPYSYETLTGKPDMQLTTVGGAVPGNRADVVAQAKKNAAKVGKVNPKDGSVSVHVDDIDADVVLSTAGLRHGLDRRFDVNAPVTLHIGEILKHSIRINEMTPSKKTATGSYALIGAAKTEDGQLYIVRSVVNQFSNELDSIDVLYAVNAKTEVEGIKKGNQAGDYPQGSPSVDGFLTDSAISIAQLLDYVNRFFPDILPESVLRHYGHDARPEGKLGNDALYSERDADGHELSAEQQEFFRDSKVRDGRGRLLVVYHGTDADFTVFEKRKGVRSLGLLANYEVDTRGFFFSPDITYSSEFGKKVKAYYLDVKNPLVMASDRVNLNNLDKSGKTAFYDEERIDELYYILEPAIKDILEYRFEESYSLYEDTDENIKLKKRWALKDLWEHFDGDIFRDMSLPWEVIDNANFSECVMRMVECGYDGMMVNEGEGMPNSWFVLDSNQAKLTTNKTPTTDPDIRFSLRDVDPIEPTTDKWQRTLTTSEVKKLFPNLWDVSADESEVRNPTQISGTVKSYRKVYDFLKKAGFKGTILDASSGLGYGTRAGIEEYGFDVEDIEPYPDKSYTPKYTDYSALDKKYDAIISNAVLNVIPQDQRDALVVKMGELLKVGGRMFINVRGDDVKNASSKVAINENLMEYYISKSGSYQKGFTKAELVAYLQDALGDGFTVTPTTFFGKASAVVTKVAEQTRFSERDSDSISTRTLLANALESAAQNDIERKKLAEYKAKIQLIEAEQAKLSEIRAKIRELSFAKGPRDTEQIRSLQFEENQAANRINTYDRQLLNLQSTEALKRVLEREKKLAYAKAKREGQEALAAYRERSAKTQRELITRYQESRKKAVEGRNKTAMRHKIKDIAHELDTLLRNPTSKKHIKEELRKAVAEALLAINLDTVGAEERVARYDALIARATDPDVIAELTASRDRIQLQGENLKAKLDALRVAYERIKDSEDIELSMSYQEVIRNSIDAVSKKVGNTSIHDMTLEQLEAVYELYSMIRKTIRNANKLFKQGKAEGIMQTAEAVNAEVRKVGGERNRRPQFVANLQRIGWKLLKPLFAFRTIGSDTLTELYTHLQEGEGTFYGDVSAAQEFIKEQYKKHGYKAWDLKKTVTFTAKSGKSFKLTLEQMMSLYAYSRREQAHAHIIEGGIVFEDAVVVEKKHGIPIKYEVTTKDAFNISEETLAEIVGHLTAEQRAFVEEMQAYLSDTMGAKGNEVSMELLGVKLFRESFYLPIKSSQYYLNFSTEEAGEIKLKSPAFSRETVQHANNPIVLHGFTDLWAEHVSNMSMYHSFVLALEDFTRVYNYKTRTDALVETMSTKKTIETAYPGATKYISDFLKSLNGGVRMDTVGFAEKLTSLTKKSAVLGSWSVMIQQPSAMMRAMAHISPVHFVTSAHKSINLLKHRQDWEELRKYATVAGIKEMGRFDVGMGKDTVDWIKANGTVITKLEDILSFGPAFMDEVTWVSIWNAVKRETLHRHKNLSPNSEEFLKIAGARFTEVISLTQVYDSVFSRSDLMRNKSWIAKALTAFMAEPTTTLNMLWDSWVQGKRTHSVKGFAKVTSATAGAVVSSIIVNAALKSIVMAMRDDDDDESYAESYVEHFFGDAKDSINPLTLIPVVKDVVSIFNGYDVERMDMALFSDLKNAIDAFDSDTKSEYEKWSGLAGAISSFFGLPLKNVERDIRGLITTIFGDSESTTAAGLLNAMEEGWTGESKSNGQQLYEAMLNGDKEQVKRVEGRFETHGDINNAVRKALRENDPRIKEAAEARLKGNSREALRLANAIVAEGHFSQADVYAAVKSEYEAMKEDKPSTSTTEKAPNFFAMEDYYNAIVGRDQATAAAVKEEMLRTAVSNGKDREEAEENFVSSFVGQLRERYEDGELSDRDAKRMLTTYAGKSDEDAEKKVQYWAFKKKYPDYDDLSEEVVTKYYSDVEPAGISIKVYYNYSKQRAKCKGTDSDGDGKTDSGSVKREVLKVINSLPISAAQKDALYFLNGWAASTLHEAPWR